MPAINYPAIIPMAGVNARTLRPHWRTHAPRPPTVPPPFGCASIRYTVVGFAGVGGMITYQDALAAAFIEV